MRTRKEQSRMERRSFLKATMALSGAFAFQYASPISGLAEAMLTPPEDEPLKEHASAKGLLYGAASQQKALSDPDFAQLFVRECAILVPEGALKWKAVHPQRDRFNFQPGDWLLHFCQKNHLLYRGHTLVWHANNPDWLEQTINKGNARGILQKHIETVVGHYAGRMHSWDVVNEVLNPSDGLEGGLRRSVWLDNIGPDYIAFAFRAAAQADPKALLMYNENHLEYDNANENTKRAAVLRLLEKLRSADVPIQGLGIQAHLRGGDSHFNAGKVRDFVREVGGMGLKVMITELDVADDSLPSDVHRRDATVASLYQSFLDAVLAEGATIGVLTWGLADRYTWLRQSRPRGDGADVRPLPFDSEMQPKPAWTAMARAFDRAPAR